MTDDASESEAAAENAPSNCSAEMERIIDLELFSFESYPNCVIIPSVLV